jgi:hypothetical protein
MTVGKDLPIQDIRNSFIEEIRIQGGQVRECMDDGQRFFGRAVLPMVEEIRKGDRLQGGVAIRALQSEIDVHPYLFRLVCSNGAILPFVLAAEVIFTPEMLTRGQLEMEVRSTIQSCCRVEAFTASMKAFRAATRRKAAPVADLSHLDEHVPAAQRAQLLDWILKRFEAQEDPSEYGLINAITSLARRVRRPEPRWGLEKYAGLLALGRAGCARREEPLVAV